MMMMETLYLSDIVEHGSWWMEDIIQQDSSSAELECDGTFVRVV
jgi:uncharacterized membrane protein